MLSMSHPIQATIRADEMTEKPTVKIKAQVMAGDVIAIGPGKAALLEEIGRTGSIAGAGRALGLSYRRTRDMVDALNACWTAPLVGTSRGGASHGGAALTPEGHEVLKAFRALTRALDIAAARHAPALLAMLQKLPYRSQTK